jgi:hypothetical protein
MPKKLNWDRAKESKQAENAISEKKNQAEDHNVSIWQAVNTQQKEEVWRLMQEPLLWESSREWLKGIHDFLKKSSSNTLLPSYVERVNRLWKTLHRAKKEVAEGKTPKPEPTREERVEFSAKGGKVFRRVWTKKELGTARPDWMDNPALLPKRPPGAK